MCRRRQKYSAVRTSGPIIPTTHNPVARHSVQSLMMRALRLLSWGSFTPMIPIKNKKYVLLPFLSQGLAIIREQKISNRRCLEENENAAAGLTENVLKQAAQYDLLNICLNDHITFNDHLSNRPQMSVYLKLILQLNKYT